VLVQPRGTCAARRKIKHGDRITFDSTGLGVLRLGPCAGHRAAALLAKKHSYISRAPAQMHPTGAIYLKVR
jgi:hypothetical protein